MGNFHFQAPGARKFLDEVGLAVPAADMGIGVFAFASAGGVDSFVTALGLGAIWKKPKKFHLIVGVDAVTNADALLRIADHVKSNDGAFTAEVFFHGSPSSTFHPKFAMFRSVAGLRLLTGSGNLTTRGLGEASIAVNPPGNWEAFGVQDFSGHQAVSHWAIAQDWIEAERAANRLRPLSDEAVQSRAMSNGLLRYSAPKPAGAPADAAGGGAAKPAVKAAAGAPIPKWSAKGTPPAVPITTAPVPVPALAPTATAAALSVTPLDTPATGQDLLIKELPKNRPGQADVGKGYLQNFFGYVAGKSTSILVQYVSLADTVGPTETIYLFENASSNYRLELHAVAGFKYEIAKDDGRTIIVVARLAPRSFRYTVVPVSSPQYHKVSALLGPVIKTNRKMRGITFALEDLTKMWPSAPSNLRPVLAHSVTP
jgi:hypothetical protein